MAKNEKKFDKTNLRERNALARALAAANIASVAEVEAAWDSGDEATIAAWQQEFQEQRARRFTWEVGDLTFEE